jgi:chemotaxis family two-component system response regulator Rcp1
MKLIHECTLLHVEDDDTTAYLFHLALQQIGVWLQFARVTDGEQAMTFLLQNGPYSSAPRPDLVLLDLKLPRKCGLDVLSEIKSNPKLRAIKVVVFSASPFPDDREKSLKLGADCYLPKDGRFEAFVMVAKLVCQKLTAEQGTG